MGRTEKPTVGDVCDVLERIAPLRLAQEWDNIGLLVGDRALVCRRVLLATDTTPPVLAEARRLGAALLVSYHPPIFRPIKTVLAQSAGTESLVHDAIRCGIAIYSPHTALDAAEGGTNDVIAGLCGLRDTDPFEFVTAGPAEECKVVTFVPQQVADRVAEAMFAAGAGRIGAYEKCSYRVKGEGTFFGTEQTCPAVGRKGRLERVEEIRLEMVAPSERLPEIVAAMRRAHPYETPAYDVYPLRAPLAKGIGRVGRLPGGTTLGSLAQSLRRRLGIKVVQVVGDPKRLLRTAAVCAGAAGRLPLELRRSAGADVIVTGEIRHHDALAFLRAGRCAIGLGHWESERPVLPVLAGRLKQSLPRVRVDISRADAAPIVML